MKKPHILLTNDDGILAPGLRALFNCVKDVAHVSVVAPDVDRSGEGLGITFRTPLQAEPLSWEGAHSVWKANGTPADCVKLALGVLLVTPPDLILSGINRGSNAGRTALYSGTVGAVIEGGMRGIPGIAFSYSEMERMDYSAAEGVVEPLVRFALEKGLPRGTILNVNFPFDAVPKGVRFGSQGRSYWRDAPDARVHPKGMPYYWLGGRWSELEELEGSDVALLREGYVAVAPLHVDDLTDRGFLETCQREFEAAKV